MVGAGAVVAAGAGGLVAVGGTGVAVGGRGVAVGVAPQAARAPPARLDNVRARKRRLVTVLDFMSIPPQSGTLVDAVGHYMDVARSGFFCGWASLLT